MSATTDTRPAPARRARPRPNRWKVLFAGMLVLGVLGTTAWLLLGSKLLVVRHVDVSGTRTLPRDRVVAVGGVGLGSPMVRLDTGAVERRLEALPQVESVTVSRDWPATVRIAVVERIPVVVAATGGRFAGIDHSGVVVFTVDARPAGMPLLSVANPGPADPSTLAAMTAYRSLPRDFTARLTEVDAPSPESISFRLSGGVTVIWGAPERAAEKLRLVAALTRGTARVIDVSSPEVVTTR